MLAACEAVIPLPSTAGLSSMLSRGYVVSEDGIEPPTRGFSIPSPKGVTVRQIKENWVRLRAL